MNPEDPIQPPTDTEIPIDQVTETPEAREKRVINEQLDVFLEEALSIEREENLLLFTFLISALDPARRPTDINALNELLINSQREIDIKKDPRMKEIRELFRALEDEVNTMIGDLPSQLRNDIEKQVRDVVNFGWSSYDIVNERILAWFHEKIKRNKENIDFLRTALESGNRVFVERDQELGFYSSKFDELCEQAWERRTTRSEIQKQTYEKLEEALRAPRENDFRYVQAKKISDVEYPATIRIAQRFLQLAADVLGEDPPEFQFQVPASFRAVVDVIEEEERAEETTIESPTTPSQEPRTEEWTPSFELVTDEDIRGIFFSPFKNQYLDIGQITQTVFDKENLCISIELIHDGILFRKKIAIKGVISNDSSDTVTVSSVDIETKCSRKIRKTIEDSFSRFVQTAKRCFKRHGKKVSRMQVEERGLVVYFEDETTTVSAVAPASELQDELSETRVEDGGLVPPESHDEPFFPRDDTETSPRDETRRREPVEDVSAEPHTGPTAEPIVMDQGGDGIFSRRRDRFHLSKRAKVVGGSVLAGVLGIGGYMLAHKLLEPEEGNNESFSKEEQKARKAGFEALDRAMREATEEGRRIDLEKIARLQRYEKPSNKDFREFDDPTQLSEAQKIAIEGAQSTALPFGSLEVADKVNFSDSLGKTPQGKVAFEIKDGKVVEWMGMRLKSPVSVENQGAGDEVVKQVLQQFGFIAEIVNRNSKGWIGVRLQDDHFIVVDLEGRVIYADHKSFVPGIALTDTILSSRLRTTFREFTEGLEKKKKDPKVQLGWAPFPRDIFHLRLSLHGISSSLSESAQQIHALRHPERLAVITKDQLLEYGEWYTIGNLTESEAVVKMHIKYPSKKVSDLEYDEKLRENDEPYVWGPFVFLPKGQILPVETLFPDGELKKQKNLPFSLTITIGDSSTGKIRTVPIQVILPYPTK